MVYSNDINKWIWIDPSFDAYVMDEKGILLGIEEVRERLINGKPLILSPDANWNRQQTQTKEFYLENYMAKNLYKLETPLVSEYNTETSEKGKVIKYVQLTSAVDVPLKKSYQLYSTHNPKLFWAKPE
jgi:hypothetical protein